MPKDKSNSQLSSTHSKASPYSRPPENPDQCPKSLLHLAEGEKDWEDTICVICMEPPHNAVLLMCSSHEKGCRPYMCDTSSRHSNCLDQYKKTSPIIQAIDPVDEVSLSSSHIKKFEHKLPCPLCRGKVSGWMVVEAARTIMNSKCRSCSLESCNFSGTYKQLRKHARRDHPSLRPTEADPTRLEQWSNLVNEDSLLDIAWLVDLIGPEDYLDMDFDSLLTQQTDFDFDDMDDDWGVGLDTIPFDTPFHSINPYLLSAYEGLGHINSNIPPPIDIDTDLDQSHQLDDNTGGYPNLSEESSVSIDLDQIMREIGIDIRGDPSNGILEHIGVPINDLDFYQSIPDIRTEGNSSEESNSDRDETQPDDRLL